MGDCTCDNLEHYVQWIGSFFGQCVSDSPVRVIAFFFGLLNIAIWLFAQVPQLIKNFMHGSAESLSPAFLITWLLGDITNFVGCILTHQLPVQTYTGGYFCFMDILLLGQYGYFAIRKYIKGRKDALELDENKHLINDSESSAEEDEEVLANKRFVSLVGMGSICALTLFSAPFLISSSSSFSANIASATESHVGTRNLLGDSHKSCEPHPDLSLGIQITGDICAWTSGILYFTARIPQIIHNFRRKSVEGLSMPMFLCAGSANFFYGLSILMSGPDFKSAKFWESTFPYLLGSICTLTGSFTILAQFWIYRNRQPKEERVTIE
eukprot:gb/GECH01014193.1/.p1 GENE.gb/GECH01014193.1/~~gb/GECH01014193.1/.p1  ORF type:complete len:324 (+),score=32.71 gb/GECH01014193.1/:1-972(+)